MAITLPVHRHECAWHFYANGFRGYPLIANQGLFGESFEEEKKEEEEKDEEKEEEPEEEIPVSAN